MRLLFVIFLLIGTIGYSYEGPSWLSAGGGILKPNDPRGAYLIDVRSPLFRKVLRGQLGVIGQGVKSGYVYAGLGFETVLLGPLYCYLHFSPGVYFQGEGLFLGFPLEFRSSVDLIFEICPSIRLGSAFFHISNASLGERNPGVNGVIFYFSYRL